MGKRMSLDPRAHIETYIYPAFFTYLLLAIYSAYFVFGYLFGIFAGAYDFAVEFLVNPTWFYIFGRSASLLLSLLIIVVFYYYLRRYSSETEARISAIIATLSAYFTYYSGYATPEIMLILFSSLATLQILVVQKTSSPKDFLMLGIYCGLAIGVKYNAAILFAGLIVVYFQHYKSIKKHLFIMIAGMIFSFILVNPYWIINPEKFYSGIKFVSEQSYSALSSERGINYIWELTELVKNELLLGILFIVSVLFSFKYNLRKNLPFLTIIIISFLYVGSWNKKGIDYLFPIFPSLIILSSAFLVKIFEQYRFSRKKIFILMSVIFIPSLILLLHRNLLVLHQDTREQATDWVLEHVSQKDKICYLSSHYDLGIYDIDRYITYGIGAKDIPDEVKQKLEQFRMSTHNIGMVPDYYKDTTAVSKFKSRFRSVHERFKQKSLDQLRQQNVRYMIVRDDIYKMYLDADDTLYPSYIVEGIVNKRNFYLSLMAEYDPIHVIEPSMLIKRPEISIYDLNEGDSDRY